LASPKQGSGLFRRVGLAAAEGSAASGVLIRLPGGVEIELGHDRAAIEQVVGQVLQHQHQGESHQDRSNGGRSC
jgi:hypothetical protein